MKNDVLIDLLTYILNHVISSSIIVLIKICLLRQAAAWPSKRAGAWIWTRGLLIGCLPRYHLCYLTCYNTQKLLQNLFHTFWYVLSGHAGPKESIKDQKKTIILAALCQSKSTKPRAQENYFCTMECYATH